MLSLVYGKMSPLLEKRSLWLNLSGVLSSLTNWVSSSHSVNLIIPLCTGTLSWSFSLFLEYVRHISCSVTWFGLKRAGLPNIYHLKNCSSPGSIQDTECLGLVHWDEPEGWYGEGDGRGFRMGNMCTPVADAC